MNPYHQSPFGNQGRHASNHQLGQVALLNPIEGTISTSRMRSDQWPTTAHQAKIDGGLPKWRVQRLSRGPDEVGEREFFLSMTLVYWIATSNSLVTCKRKIIAFIPISMFFGAVTLDCYGKTYLWSPHRPLKCNTVPLFLITSFSAGSLPVSFDASGGVCRSLGSAEYIRVEDNKIQLVGPFSAA